MICVLAALGVSAQSHTFRDTSNVRYEQFDFDEWVFGDSTNRHGRHFQNKPLYPFMNSSWRYADLLQYNYTDNPDGMEVVGLSAVVHLDQHVNPPAEYLFLYDVHNDTFDLMAQVEWFEDDTADRPIFEWWERTANCDTAYGFTYYYQSSDFWQGVARNYRIFDYYFDSDKPIVVHDSFYVGGTCHGNMGMFSSEPVGASLSSYLTFMPTNTPITCDAISLWKVYCYERSIWPQFEWFWTPSNQFLMVLPIIRVVDTSFANAPECPRVSGLFVRGNNTDTVTMQWNYDSLHSNFELTYGPEGTPPEEGIYRMLNTNRWQFSDVAYLDTPMVAYVRTVCREYDTLRWSGWSSPMYFRLHHEADTTHSGDVGVPDDEGDLSRFVQLMPNPASGSVVVMSSYGIDLVEVYDVRGNRVLEQKGQNRATHTGFDVSAWAKGAYVVLVHTPAGTTARRLMVQ